MLVTSPGQAPEPAQPAGGAAACRLPAAWAADQALTELYRGHYRPLVRMAALLLHDVAAAEEVVQDSFVAMNAAWPRLRDDGRALAYLRRSVLNRGRSLLRRRQVAERHAPAPEPDAPSAEQDAILLLERSAVTAALRRLPPRQREALVLRFYLDLSQAQIAEAMGVTSGAVKAHTARAMAAMRRAMAAPGPPGGC